VQGKVLSSRGLRRGLMVTTLVLGVALFAGPSSATHGGPHLSISGGSATEGGEITFTVTLSDRDLLDTSTITVQYTTVDAVAGESGDYTANSGTLNFIPTDNSETVVVQTAEDELDEPDETFSVTLSNPSSGVEITTASATGTIEDDDAQPALEITDETVTEGNAGTVSAVFDITLSAPSGQTVMVNYATADGSASAPADYTAIPTSPTQTLTFTAGQTTKQVTVVVQADTLDELNETYFVNLSGAVNASLLDPEGLGTITDDDNSPSLSINDLTVTEGHTGTVFANFTVSLSAASGQDVTVSYATANGSGTAPSDYNSISTTSLIFTPGQTTKTVTVLVNGDTVDEPNETFHVNLSGAVNASISDPEGLGTITDDDNSPSLAVGNATVTEGDAGTVNANFTVTMSGQTELPVSVNYATADVSALAPGDFTSKASPPALTFTNADPTETITVAVNGDLQDEPTETFHVDLSGALNATISDSQGVGTITDDDSPPTVSISSPAAVTEGSPATFNVNLSAASGQTVTVNYAATHVSTNPADLTTPPPLSGTLTLNPGDTTKQLPIATVNDTTDEADSETFNVTLSVTETSNATLGTPSQATGTINDDDAPPQVSINSATGPEGTPPALTVTLSPASGRTVTVNYSTTNGTAVAPGDFTAVAGGTVTFAAGEVSKPISIATANDALDENDEIFTVTLTTGPTSNATIGTGLGTGTITDDPADLPPTVSIANAPTVTEGTPTSFTVNLSAPSGKAVTVNYSTGDETAAAPGDYTAVTGGTVTFLPGPPAQTTQQIQIQTSGDTLDENPETFRVTLADPVNAAIAAPGFGTGTLNDDPADVPPTVSITGGGAVAEGDPALFNVTLSAPSGKTVTVNYTHAHVTTSTADFAGPLTGTLTFNPLETTKQASLATFNDTIDEADTETFTVTIAGPVNATLGAQPSAAGTINDNDAPPTVSISPGRSAVEGTAPTLGACAATPPAPGPPPEGCVYFTVTLSAASGREVRVQYSTADATTEGAADYLQVSGQTLIFPAGSVAPQTIGIRIERDAADESDEIVLVNLSSPTNATISPTAGQGSGTIIDDDGPPELSVQGSIDSEAHPEGATNVLITVLPASQLNVVSVRLRTIDQTARGGVDYGAVDQIVTFPTGVGVQTISIPLLNDGLDEEDETFVVQLSQPQNATIKNDQGQLQDRAAVRIRDDDPAPTVSIGNSTVSEGNSGAVSASFTVTLSTASGLDVSVAYASAGGSAAPAEDFTATFGLLSFPPGQTSKTVNVAVHGDVLFEPDESFFVNLTNPVNATIADGQGAGTITNDDLPPPEPPPPLPPPPPPPPDPGPTTTTSTSTSTSTSTTTSTGTTTTNAAPTSLDGMGISSAPVKLLDDLAPVAVACSKQAKDTCFGTVLIQGRSARTLAIVNGRPTAKTVMLGRESFAIRRGRTEKVLVRLSIRAVRAVKRAGKLRVNVVVTARDSAGRRAKPIRRALWLKAAKTPRKAKTSARR
jgi:hypothetical protein